MSPLRRVGSVFVIAGLLFILAAPAISNSSGDQSDDASTVVETLEDSSVTDLSETTADSGEAESIQSKRDGAATCPAGQARVDEGNHKGQCVDAPQAGAAAGDGGISVAPDADALSVQTTVKMVIVQIVQRSCEVRNGVSETNVTFSFRHNGLNTTGKVEMTITGPTGVIVISEKTEFELPEGTYLWTVRSIDSEYEIEGPNSGELAVLSCAASSTTTTTTTVPSTTTTTVPVSATTVTSPTTTTTSSSTTSSTSTTTTSTSTTVPPTSSTTVPPEECEPPDCLPYTGPADEYWPMAIFGGVLMITGMAALALSRLVEERQERIEPIM